MAVPKHMTPGLSHLRVTFSEQAYVGPGRADLLELIAETGSISAAGRQMGMSYRRAWMLVQALNDGFGVMVETTRGGSEQGGARLTETGVEVLRRYRHMQAVTREAIAEDVRALQAIADMHPKK
ncbi:MAG TPA: winged helix-turn-helix domain-containing protein [Devosiaceae bacterium]|jgi:molybdate transport system regulatory protein